MPKISFKKNTHKITRNTTFSFYSQWPQRAVIALEVKVLRLQYVIVKQIVRIVLKQNCSTKRHWIYCIIKLINCPRRKKIKSTKSEKNNSPRKLPSSEGSPLKSGRLQRNKKIPIDDDPDFIPDLPEKAEQKNKEDIQDKTFYCYRRMQDLDAKCCKQCEKTKLTSNECKH